MSNDSWSNCTMREIQTMTVLTKRDLSEPGAPPLRMISRFSLLHTPGPEFLPGMRRGHGT